MKKAEFGEKLQELRTKRGESQQVLGKLLGVGVKQIQRYEAGGAPPPHESLEILSNHYGYDLISLLYDLPSKDNGTGKANDRYIALLEKVELKNEKIIETQEEDLKALRSAVNKITNTDQRVGRLETTVGALQHKWQEYEPTILGLREFVTGEIANLKKKSHEEVAAALNIKVEEQQKKVEQSYIQKG